MNATNATTTRQFHALAPGAIKRGRRTFTRNGGTFDDATNTVRFDYVARKRRGAFLADKVSASVTYVRGSDLYDVEIVAFDGETFETSTLYSGSGLFFDSFADVGTFVEIADKGAK